MARKPTSGPASDPEVLILSSLATGPKHGYAMMSDIETFAGVWSKRSSSFRKRRPAGSAPTN
jgi:DNA-binding PadR family transcriptional regulator